MVDKAKERWYIERLRAAWNHFPDGRINTSERPDFLVIGASSTFGIEITEFVLDPVPGDAHHQETESLRRQVMERAHAHYRNAGGPPLMIDVEFDDRVRLTKRDIDATARHLAACISAYHFTESDAPGWIDRLTSVLPKGIQEVSGNSWRQTDSWDVGGGGWVRACNSAHVQAVVNRKAAAYDAYRGQCDAVALVIVFSAFSGPPTDVPLGVLEHAYETPFDATLAFFVDLPGVVPLHRA